MPASSDKLTYSDCYVIFKRALEDNIGIRLKFTSNGAAMHLRTRLHIARKLDRAEGTSLYDPLIIRIREEDGIFWLYIERIVPLDIEPLSPPVSFETIEEGTKVEPKTFIRRI